MRSLQLRMQTRKYFLGLVVAGAAGLSLQFPIAIAITILLGIVALSYSQTIQGYPSGGGSYVVAKENLGTYPGLVAAAALLLDYILTAAVSLDSWSGGDLLRFSRTLALSDLDCIRVTSTHHLIEFERA